MRRSRLRTVPIAALFLAACSSTAADKGAATGKTVDQAATEVELCLTHLDATLLSLKDLVEKPAADLGPQYKAFASNLSKLESTASDIASLAASMEAKSQEYFEKWDEQLATVENEKLRERGAERRKTIEAAFKKIRNEYSEARDEFKPLLADLRDVHKVLDTDLTLDGLKAVEDTVEDVADECGSVRESLQELGGKFRELGVKLSRAGPTPEEPKK